MIACFIIIGIAICLLVWYLVSKCQKYDLKELFIKTGISVLFIVVALVASFSSGHFSIFNVLIIIGLMFGLIGDILLDLKYIDIERTKGYTYSGFIVFGIGHILFITALIMNFYQGNILFIILPILLDIVLAALTILLEKPLKLQYGNMKLMCCIYALCLFGTLSFSLFLAIQNGFQIVPLNLFLVGSALFAISDLVLSGTYFGIGKEKPIDFILNYLTYYGAQFVLAMSLLFL